MNSPEGHGFRLSPPQRYISALTAGNYAHFPFLVSGAIEIVGTISLAEVKQLLREVVQRHEILRTRFAELPGDGGVLQIVDDLEPHWETSDWTSLSPQGLLSAIDETVRSGLHSRIDLRRGPVMHVHLARAADARWLAFVVLPALCADAASIAKLARHLAVAHAEKRNGSRAIQNVLQYADVAEWMLHEEAQGAPSDHSFRHEGGLRCDGAESKSSRCFSPGYSARLLPAEIQMENSRHAQALLPVWANLLCRRFQERRGPVALLVQCDGASHVELEDSLGPLADYLPICPDVDPLEPFGRWAAEIGEKLDDIRRRHQPFRWTLANGTLDGIARPRWAFGIADRSASTAADDIRVSVLLDATVAADFALSLQCVRRPVGWRLELVYDGRLLSAQQATDVLDAYAADLTRFVGNPGLRLRHGNALSERETAKIIAESSGEIVELSHRALLHEPFELQAAQAPSAPALEFEGRSLTYQQVDRLANRLAHALRQHGVQPEDVIAIWGERSLELPVGLLAILKAGAAFLALDPELPDARLAVIAQDAGAKRVLVAHKQMRQLPSSLPCEAVAVCIDQEDDLRLWDRPPTTSVSADHLAYVIYTSGSTGKPKGALVTHRAVSNQMQWIQKHWPLFETDRVLLKTSCGFDPCLWEIFWPLMNGARVIIAHPRGHRDAAYLCRLSADRKVSSSFFVPSMLMNMLADPGIQNITRFRTILCGGEAVSMQTCRTFHENAPGDFLHLYGPAEAAIAVYGCILPRGGATAFAPLGRPVANSRVFLMDEFLGLVPDGAIGEICISGSALSRGYLNLPGRTAQSFLPDPYAQEPGGRLYRTGDLARRHADGSIEFVGRADRQVKIHGSRVELSDVEHHLNMLPSVAQGAVITQPNGAGDKKLVGYVVRRDGRSDAAALRRELQERLPAYAVPADIVFIDEMPLNANGKLDRTRLPTLPRVDISPSDRSRPHSLVEQLLLKTWREVLQVEEIGTEDDFFALGGHSLLAAQVAARIERGLQVSVPLRAMLDLTTVTLLAPLIEYQVAAEMLGYSKAAIEEAVDAYAADPTRSISSFSSQLSAAQRQQVEQRFARALRGSARTAIPRLGLTDAPLSFAQRRMWFLEQLSPGTSVFNVPVAVRISGNLSVDRLARAFDQLVTRHEILRVRLYERDGEPFQLVSSDAHVPLTTEDWSDAASLGRKLRDEAWRPFNLDGGPLVRAMLIRQSPSECVLLITLHHIICDDWSMGVLVRDVLAFYAEREGDLLQLPIQYFDYCEWQRQRLGTEEMSEQIEYWRDRLRELPEELSLPVDHGGTSVPEGTAGLRPVQLGPELRIRIEEFARSRKVTLFMVLLSALDALFYCLSEQTDLVIGVPVASRSPVEAEPLIGLFLNPVVIRTRVRPDLGFEDILDGVRQSVVEAYQNQDAPYESVVNALGGKRSRNLFRVWFSLQNAPAPDVQLPGLHFETLLLEPALAKFDLALLLRQDALAGFFEYRKDLFAGNIEAIVTFWERILMEVTAAPNVRLSTLRQRWTEHVGTRARSALSDFQGNLRRSFEQFRAVGATREAAGGGP